MVWSTLLPGITLIELLVAGDDVQVNRVVFRDVFIDPSASPSIVYVAEFIELGATTLLPLLLSHVPTATALAGSVSEYATQSSDAVAQALVGVATVV